MLHSTSTPPPNAKKRRARGLFSWAIVVAFIGALLAAIVCSGLSFTTVPTDSMDPMIKPHDYVVTVDPALDPPHIGSVVVASNIVLAGHQLPRIVHRIVGQNPDGTWQTKGDNNPGQDDWHISNDQIDGVVVAVIPTHFIATKIVTMILLPVGLAGLVLLLIWPRDEKDDDVFLNDCPADDAPDRELVGARSR